MTSPIDLAVAAITGGGGTLLTQTFAGWLKSRRDRHTADRSADVKLEEHRDQLTFDLLDAARKEMAQLRGEVSDLRTISGRVAHLEEALDHIHELLHADGEVEQRAARRRAQAYLRRMRPEVGDLRNSIQVSDSARAIVERAKGDGK